MAVAAGIAIAPEQPRNRAARRPPGSGNQAVAGIRWTRRLPACKALVRDHGFPDDWRTSGQWRDFARAAGGDDVEIMR
jgi:hypothetical protein